jgi:hypothetical protein
LARFTLFITFLFFSDNFEVIKSVYFLQNVKNKTEKSFSNLAVSQFCFSRSNKSTTPLQFLFLQGCVIVALQGCVIVALQGCINVALQGCVIAALQGCVIVALQVCVIIALQCCVSFVLQGCVIVALNVA